MNSLLAPGDQVSTEGGRTCAIQNFIGSGGQGEVYSAQLDGQAVAVKIYFPDYLRADTNLRDRLTRAIQKGPPSSRFLWPQALVEQPEFGYVMPLRDPRFRGIVEVVTREVELSFDALARAGFELAESFGDLHVSGLCYRDISFGNVFMDPDKGEILVCDNDNVDVNGEEGGILGTPRFIAPEVVRREAMPSTQSDQYSLAVLLFYLLMNHHPLEGQKEFEIHALDLPAMKKLYGTEPLFIFDPADESNRPVPGTHDNALIFWELYPEFLRRHFTRSFTDGLRDPQHGRVLEVVWKGAMARLRDSIFHCPQCGVELFYDVEKLRGHIGLGSCWKCSSTPSPGFRLRFSNRALDTHVGSSITILHDSRKIFPHHTDPIRTFDFSAPVAEVNRHPTQPEILGLKNLDHRAWTADRGDGQLKEVPPGKSFTLRDGARINFGKVEAEVRG